MNFDLVMIVNKYIENDRTFVLFDGFAYIFWEGVWLQYATEANLQNGIYDRDLKLRKRLHSFSLPDISGDEWVEISFERIKDFSKVSTTGPDMILGLALHSDGPKVHVYSSDLSLYLASKFDQFEAKIVSKYLALLKKSDGDAMVFYCNGLLLQWSRRRNDQGLPWQASDLFSDQKSQRKAESPDVGIRSAYHQRRDGRR